MSARRFWSEAYRRSSLKPLGREHATCFCRGGTVEKQLRRHRDLPIAYYSCLGRCLRLGEYRQDAVRTAVVLFADVELYKTNFRACLKATVAGDEIYLASFLAMRDRDYKRELRKPRPTIVSMGSR